MVDCSTIYVRDYEDGNFVEEDQEGLEQAASEQLPQQQQQPLRGLGTNLIAAAKAVGSAVLGKPIAPKPLVGRPIRAPPVIKPVNPPKPIPRGFGSVGPVPGPVRPVIPPKKIINYI